MWLRDCLPQDLQGARILLYGYDTSLLGSQSFQGIYDTAITFTMNLRSIRKTSKVSALGGQLPLEAYQNSAVPTPYQSP